jgi:signal transduction histidine kinase
MHMLSMLLRGDTASTDFIQKADKLVADALKQTGRLVRLIETLLDTSTIGAGRLTLNRETVDLCALTREVVERLADQFVNAHSNVVLHLCESAFGAWDKFRVEQIVTNLLTNAIKYGSGQPIGVSVETDEGAAILKVKDRGIGIPRDAQSRIFERFERVNRRGGPSGLGLGLYIVRQIIEAHRGSISVDSTPGQGSEFTVRLPLDVASARDAAA